MGGWEVSLNAMHDSRAPIGRMQVAMASDDNYVPHMAATIASLTACTPANRIDLYIVAVQISERNVEILTTFIELQGFASYQIIDFNESRISTFRTDGHITVASYIRLFLPSLLPKEVQKLIYLDSDLAIVENLGRLWDTQIGGALVAAAPDLLMPDRPRLDLPRDHKYVNAGVLLIDLAGWRRAEIEAKAVKIVSEEAERLRFHDQDVINMLMTGQIKLLDIRWNLPPRVEYYHTVQIGMTRRDYTSLFKRPFIVHYTTNKKPWHFTAAVRFELLYIESARRTPWGYHAAAGVKPGARVRRALLIVKRQLGRSLRFVLAERYARNFERTRQKGLPEEI